MSQGRLRRLGVVHPQPQQEAGGTPVLDPGGFVTVVIESMVTLRESTRVTRCLLDRTRTDLRPAPYTGQQAEAGSGKRIAFNLLRVHASDGE